MGRQKLDQSEKRITMSVSLPPDLISRIEGSRSDVVERSLRMWFRVMDQPGLKAEYERECGDKSPVVKPRATRAAAMDKLVSIVKDKVAAAASIARVPFQRYDEIRPGVLDSVAVDFGVDRQELEIAYRASLAPKLPLQ